MDIATTPLTERVARVLAAQAVSVNGEGDLPSASSTVDSLWTDHVDAARAVLKTLREPTAAMERAGDAAVWERMILAGLNEDRDLTGSGE